MDVTPNEARQLLGKSDAITALMRNHSMYLRIGPTLMLWGVIWLACFPLTAGFPHASGWIWLVGDIIGFAGSALSMRRSAAAIRCSSSTNKFRGRVLWFWLALLAYGCFWMFLLAPAGPSRAIVFIVTLIMFAYVAIGLLTQVRFMLILGLGVTLLAVAGFLLFASQPSILNLWMGITGGVTLLGTGAFITHRSR